MENPDLIEVIKVIRPKETALDRTEILISGMWAEEQGDSVTESGFT